MDAFQKKVKQLETLVDVAALLNSSLDHDEVINRAITATTKVVDAEVASLLLLDEETGELYFDVATGEQGEKIKQVRLKKGMGIAGQVAENGEALIIYDAQADPRFFKDADKASGFVTRDILCVAVKTRERIIGVLEAINKKDGKFDESDLDLINTLSNFIAIAIENARLYTELKETFYVTAEALAETIELRDPYTGGHTKRVKDYSLIIGQTMGFNKAELEKLMLSAILHDIGKIGVRDNVLLKQGSLEKEEFIQMSMHPQNGSALLTHVKRLKDVIPGVRNHHERYDGTGYPDGLKGSDISIIARIIAVADTYDAMTTDRPYRKGLTQETAFTELDRCSGTQFDPEVVRAFLSAYPEEPKAVAPI